MFPLLDNVQVKTKNVQSIIEQQKQENQGHEKDINLQQKIQQNPEPHLIHPWLPPQLLQPSESSRCGKHSSRTDGFLLSKIGPLI